MNHIKYSLQMIIITLDPETTILGGPEMYVDTVSGIVNLTCLVDTNHPPKSVEWFHNQTKVTTIY